jgi:predicted acyltransferase
MNRLISIDVLRGITIALMILVNTPGSWSFVYPQLLHAEWDGLKLADLVFPFFMFVVGVSMFYSIQQTTNKNKPWVQKSIVRGIKLVLIGIALNWYPFFTKNFEVLRLFGILQRIGLAYIGATILLYLFRCSNLLWMIATVTVGYWLILLTIGDGDLSLEGNLVRQIDLALVGSAHIYKGYGIAFDPEGLLSTLPSIGNILIGFWVASLLDRWTVSVSTLLKLIGIGLTSITVGIIWSVFMGFPINKPIWSSSYVLVTSGLCVILWAELIYFIDILKINRGVNFFRVFGQNAIISFVLSGLVVKTFGLIKIDGKGILTHAYESAFAPIFGQYGGSLMFAITYVLFIWAIAYVLDKKGIYIKV